MIGANIYSSSDEASSDDEVSDWSNQRVEDDDVLELNEEQDEERQVAVIPGRPKRQKIDVDPPLPIELISSQKKKKDGSDNFLAVFQGI